MKSPFQTILIIIFAIVFAGAVFVFSGLIPIGKKAASTTPTGTVVMWGIAPQSVMQPYLDAVANKDYHIQYEEHNADTLHQDLIVALANGTPPDLILFSSEQFSQFEDKLYPIPYSVYSERSFRDANIDGAQIFLSKDGVVGVPLVVDPLVVYYNKDILAKSNFVVPPTTWKDLQQSIALLTVKDAKGALTQSTIALGTANNVDHMRDILSALFLQTGNNIISYDGSSGNRTVVLAASPSGSTTTPTAQALQFYTSFSNPTSTNYSWNSALPNSLAQFLAGKSAFYIGRASELFTIQAENPNLNFDVSELFQTGADTRPITFGSFYGVGILKNAPNFTAAYAASSLLGASANVDALSKALSLPPVQRSLLLAQQPNPYVSVFFKAALSTFAWPDPNPAETQSIFQTLVNNVTSGKLDPVTAIYTADKDLQSSLK